MEGIEVDVDRCRNLLDQSLVLATPLARIVGYSKAAELSKRALAGKRSLRQVVEEEGILLPEQVVHIFGSIAGFASCSEASSA